MIEFGPHPVVSGMVKSTLGPQMTVLSTLQRNRDTWAILTGTLSVLYTSGIEIRWDEYHRDFKSSHQVLQLPAYSWDLKNYWMQYVNDWSLRKGDAPVVINAPKLDTTTVHKTVEETSSVDKTTLIVESDIARADLNPLVQGHKVDGIPLCTPVSCDNL
jgi:acyl transferase domain-containing protein